jgi:hypothetical protein
VSFSFESQFKGAIRRTYQHEPLSLRRVCLVTDLSPARAERVEQVARGFLSQAAALRHATGERLDSQALGTAPQLVEHISQGGYDLVITHRNLRESPRSPRSSLGNYLDSLTQATEAPVLVLPVRRRRDEGASQLEARLENTDRVMVITDHLTEDPALIRYGAEFTQPGGLLFLSHVEDEATFERYMDIISKIPEIDDDLARERIKARLLKEARQFCESAAVELHTLELDLTVKPLVSMGRPLEDYRRMLSEHQVDLLVADSKTPDRYAMSASAYAATVEFIDTPILLL